MVEITEAEMNKEKMIKRNEDSLISETTLSTPTFKS